MIRILAGVIIGTTVLAGVQTWRLHRAQLEIAELRLQIQTERQQATEAALKAQAQYRTIENAWVRKHQEIASDTQNQTRRNAIAANNARSASDSLRIRAAETASRCDAPSNSPVAAASASAPSAGVLLADVLGRLETAGRELASLADSRGTAGVACERAYDALIR